MGVPHGGEGGRRVSSPRTPAPARSQTYTPLHGPNTSPKRSSHTTRVTQRAPVPAKSRTCVLTRDSPAPVLLFPGRRKGLLCWSNSGVTPSPFSAPVFPPPTASQRWTWEWGRGRKDPRPLPAHLPRALLHLQAMPSHSRASRRRSSTTRSSPRATAARGRTSSATGTTRAMDEVTPLALLSTEISTSKAADSLGRESPRVQGAQEPVTTKAVAAFLEHFLHDRLYLNTLYTFSELLLESNKTLASAHSRWSINAQGISGCMCHTSCWILPTTGWLV